MPGTFTLDIVTPERQVYEGEVTELQAPGLDGLFGVLHNRAPLLAALGPGQVKFAPAAGGTRFVAITGGFFEMAGNHAVLLADQAEFAEEIDAAEAQLRLEEARRELMGLIPSEDERRRREAAMAAAATRVRVAARVR
jgi:F-type H+-transporting ATPase subunit epsilon